MKFLTSLLSLRLILLVAGSISLAACNKEDNNEFVKVPVKGAVRLLDEFGRPEADNGGVDVRILSIIDSKPETSSSAGLYTQKAYVGNQLFLFAKKDYADFLLWDQPVETTTTTLPTVTLAKIATASVTSLSIVERNDTLFISGRMTKPSSPGQIRNHRIFFIQHRFNYPGDACPQDINQDYIILTISGKPNVGNEAFRDTLTIENLKKVVDKYYPPVLEVIGYGDNLSAVPSRQLTSGSIFGYETTTRTPTSQSPYTGKLWLGGLFPAVSRDSSNILHYIVR